MAGYLPANSKAELKLQQSRVLTVDTFIAKEMVNNDSFLSASKKESLTRQREKNR